MKTKLFLKTLLVAACLLVGSNGAWATAVPYTVGTEGAGDEWGSRKYSDAYEIAPGETYHFTFTNTSYGSNNWNNWLLDCKATVDTSVADQYYTMRSDNYGWGTGYNSAMRYADFVWADFQTVMNGATVDMYVDYNSTDKIIRTYTTITSSDGNTTWHYNFASNAIDQSSVFLFLSEELAVLNITTAEKVASVSNGTYTLYKRTTTTTDCGEQWKADDKDNIWVPSTTSDYFTYAIDGGLSLANTSASTNFTSSYSASRVLTPNENTTVSMTAVATMGGASGRDSSYDYITIGGVSLHVNGQNQKAQVYVDNVAQGIEVNATRGASYTFNVEINQATGDVTYSVSGGATIAEATTSTSTAISNVVFGHSRGGRENFNTSMKLTNINITEQISAVSYANYTIHFQDNNGTKVKEDDTRLGEVGATVGANSGDKTTFIADGYKYVYSSDGDGTTVTSNGLAEFTVTYTKYGQYTYNVYAVNSSSVALQEDPIATATVYEDETAKLTWSKYVKIGGTWYSTSETTFRTTETEAGSRNVVYSASDVDYFFEMESLTRSGGAYLTEEDVSYSNYKRLRLSKGSLYYTPALTGGVYTISIPWVNSNNSENEVYLYTRTSGGVLSDVLETFSAPKGSGTFRATIIVPEGYSIAFNGNEGTSANNNARMDYMTLTLTGVSVTIPSSGFGTIASAYALDLNNVTVSDGTLTAYKVNEITKDYAKLAVVNGSVAAATGLILEGKPGATCTIPVAGSGTDISSTNKLQAAVNATEVAENKAYILKNGEFHKVTTASTIPAGKAYLLADDVPAEARTLSFFFEDDETTTGIADVRSETSDVRGGFFDLQGRKINGQLPKGLYIVNGKKVVIK